MFNPFKRHKKSWQEEAKKNGVRVLPPNAHYVFQMPKLELQPLKMPKYQTDILRINMN